MPQVTIKDIFNTPWGLLAKRRKEIERSSYGQFARIEKEEIEKQFLTAQAVARMMDCSESTARRWIEKHDPRFIIREGCKAFLREDALKVVNHRRAEVIRREEARRSKSAD